MNNTCPKCGSVDVVIGDYLLSCNSCEWNHNNDKPCNVCGKPAYSSCSMGEKGESIYYGCEEHNAIEYYRSKIKELNK